MRALACLILGIFSGNVSWAGDIAANARQSGFEMMSHTLQAMQAHDLANPAMLSVRAGEDLWSRPPAIRPDAVSCAQCHGKAETTMRGVSARYPHYDQTRQTPISFADKIEQCRTTRQGLEATPREDASRLALEAYLALQSRGMPIDPSQDPRLDAVRAQGRALFSQRMGQLDLSCAHCHTENWGKMLGGSLIPQAHPTGYPLYRLEWQKIGSLTRRIRNCMTGIRAEPFAAEAPEMIALELYLMQRAAGMMVDAPAVRP